MAEASGGTGGFYKFYVGLPGWAKGTIVVGTGLVAFLVGYSVWKKIGAAAAAPPANLQEPKDAASTLGTLAGQGINPTATDAQFQGWCNDLQTAFGGCLTTYDTINTVMSNMNNDADIYKLIAIFGTRPISGCLWGSSTLSLSQAMSKDASSGGIANVNSILATKGITFRFS